MNVIRKQRIQIFKRQIELQFTTDAMMDLVKNEVTLIRTQQFHSALSSQKSIQGVPGSCLCKPPVTDGYVQVHLCIALR